MKLSHSIENSDKKNGVEFEILLHFFIYNYFLVVQHHWHY